MPSPTGLMDKLKVIPYLIFSFFWFHIHLDPIHGVYYSSWDRSANPFLSTSLSCPRLYVGWELELDPLDASTPPPPVLQSP